MLLELVLGIFLASIPALVSSSLFCHVNNAKTDKTSFDIPKMCPTGFKTFNGSKSFDVKWYTFLNIFSICICFQIVWFIHTVTIEERTEMDEATFDSVLKMSSKAGKETTAL